ncbi:hypothetical protein [Christiangramia sabulilitoris]|uniref:Uncharacterized protein n=1 Tax=Christiangramia sabulilitoris TaxID=2583991 RepID=A0A550I2K1_9FLAO|nr:hypothetical protein [Christiangramia sabulilitoris]TRO65190.1 hypothetical protein FGM01_07210 [Christiangramia sabulilitoris]
MEKPENCIPRSEAHELSETWWNSRGKAIENAVKHKDVCAVNFSIAELEDYLAYVKENSKDVNDPGISIWMGTYPEDDEKVPEKKKGYSTVFLSPTRKKAPGTYEEGENDFEENEEIDPMNGGSGLWPPGVY